MPQKFRDEAKEWGWCKDEFTENGHLPLQLYVREARRMEGVYVYTEKDGDFALKDARAKQTIKDRLNSQKEVAASIYAMVQEETGTKAITGPGQIRNAIKRQWPNPAYPTQATAEAAA